MTVGTPPSRTTSDPSRGVLYGVLLVAALSFGGAVISVASDLSPDLLDAMGPYGRLSVPLPMVAFQVAMAFASTSRRRAVAMTGSGLIAVAMLAGVVSGFFDGGYAEDRLTAWQRGYQIALVTALTVVGLLAATRFARLKRSSPDRSAGGVD